MTEINYYFNLTLLRGPMVVGTHGGPTTLEEAKDILDRNLRNIAEDEILLGFSISADLSWEHYHGPTEHKTG